MIFEAGNAEKCLFDWLFCILLLCGFLQHRTLPQAASIAIQALFSIAAVVRIEQGRIFRC